MAEGAEGAFMAGEDSYGRTNSRVGVAVALVASELSTIDAGEGHEAKRPTAKKHNEDTVSSFGVSLVNGWLYRGPRCGSVARFDLAESRRALGSV